ncbi:MAG: Gfo/Idh/MocA family protein [Oscillospiraceae bacterium]
MANPTFSIIGAGNMAVSMAMAANGSRSSLTPYAIASASNPGNAGALCKQFGFQKAYASYEELLSDSNVELVYVSTLIGQHYEHVKQCLAHGKHVLCEKTFTMNAQQAEELVEMAANRKLFLGEAMWTRFLPFVAAAKRVINSGEIGAITEITTNIGRPSLNSFRHTNAEMGGGALLDRGIYAVTFAELFLGKENESISTYAEIENRVDLENSIAITYQNGAVSKLKSSIKNMLGFHAVISGTKGRLDFPIFWAAQQFTITTGAGQKEVALPFEVNGYEYELRAAAAAIAQNKNQFDEFPWADTLRIMHLLDWLRAEWNRK